VTIYVTRPSLPPLKDLMPLLEDIWQSCQISNMGKHHSAFESSLCTHQAQPYTSLFCNGTVALQTALQALHISGEVITTPFSFVATTHSIYWNRCTPVFCDIDPSTLNIDPGKIEPLITPRTTAILPVHVFGIPCNFDPIQQIAENYGLKVIYDAAHAFGVRIDGQSIFSFGDLSVVSFHATKIFNTFEGGAIFSRDDLMKRRIDFLKNFGIADETTVVAPGSNGKMNEFQAALGLLQLKRIHQDIEESKRVYERYKRAFEKIHGIQLVEPPTGVEWNYAYCPILIDPELFGASREQVFLRLKEQDIHPRRYFSPLISEYPSYRGMPGAAPESLPVAHHVSRRILCLPLYPTLSAVEQDRLIAIVLDRGGERD